MVTRSQGNQEVNEFTRDKKRGLIDPSCSSIQSKSSCENVATQIFENFDVPLTDVTSKDPNNKGVKPLVTLSIFLRLKGLKDLMMSEMLVRLMMQKSSRNLKLRLKLKWLNVKSVFISLYGFVDSYVAHKLNLVSWYCKINEVKEDVTESNSEPMFLKLSKRSKHSKHSKHSKAMKLKEIKHCSNMITFRTESSSDFRMDAWLLRCGDVEAQPGPAVADNDALTRDHDTTQELGQAARKGSRSAPVELQVISQNVRGLSDSKKVRHLVNNCYKMCNNAKDSLFLFQETYVPKLDILNYIWRGEWQVTAGTGNSLGCITLVTAPYKVVRCVEIAQRGHILALSRSDINKVELIVTNVYAPNGLGDEKVAFFEDLFERVAEVQDTYNCRKVIIAGDLNLVFEHDEVKDRLFSSAEQRIAALVKVMMQQLNIVDGWALAPKKAYTWTSSRTGVQAFSTLDRIMFSNEGFAMENKIVNWAVSVSDHAAVIATFKSQNVLNRSSLLSRLDSRLLRDTEGTEKLNEVFFEMFAQRSLDWDPHVSLEYTKMCIRTAACTATGMIKARYRDEELSLNSDINMVVEALVSETEPGNKALLMHKLDDLRQIKRSLVEKIGAKLEVRTARQWYNEGELSNKYFFSILNRKINDEVKEILKDDGWSGCHRSRPHRSRD